MREGEAARYRRIIITLMRISGGGARDEPAAPPAIDYDEQGEGALSNELGRIV